MNRFGLIGYPLEHSFSASYFSKKFKAEKIKAEYRNFPLENIGAFKTLMKRETNLRGLNVTVPYKQDIIPYLDALSPTAQAIQAVNTITFKRKDDSLHLEGDNTDVLGFRRSLEQHLKSHHTSALVLGTGGSSKAVLYVLEQLGIGFTSVSRSAGDNRITYAELDDELVRKASLIINTTPLGMHPKVDTFPRIPYEVLSPRHLLFDLVYNPAKTVFLTRGEHFGAQIVNGHDMLIFQAEASWQIWNTF